MARTVRFGRILTCTVTIALAGFAQAHQQSPGGEAESFLQRHPEILRAHLTLMRFLSEAFEQDPALEELRAEFAEAQEQAMVALDPATTSRLRRMAELRSLHDETVVREDTPDITSLLDEGRTIRRELLATATEARRQPECAKKAAAFAAALETRFQEVDPAGFQLLAQKDGWIEAVWAVLLVSPTPRAEGDGQ